MVENSDIDSLLSVLSCLDYLLEQAVMAARAQALQGEPFRGLYIGEEDVNELLARQGMNPPWDMNPDTARGYWLNNSARYPHLPGLLRPIT